MKEDKYYPPEIFKSGNITARIYRPILTEEERERRMKEIKKSAVSLVMSKEKKS